MKMRVTSNHVQDEELLSFADGELEPARATLVESHLTACWTCRTRRAELERAIVEFVQLHHQSFSSLIPSPKGPRALLKLRLAEAAQANTGSGWFQRRLQFTFSRWRMAYVSAAAVLAFLAGVALWRYAADFRQERSITTEDRFEPKSELTPGAVRPVSLSDVCRGGSSDKNRVVPVSVQREVFRKYGIPNARPEDYEVDYLITPELGGADDITNLWPQPFSAANWNAYVKDALEDRLHEMVCDGKLDLSIAQHDIATDWIGAYKKYVNPGNAMAKDPADLEDRETTQMARASLTN
jgi:hypothetical protein